MPRYSPDIEIKEPILSGIVMTLLPNAIKRETNPPATVARIPRARESLCRLIFIFLQIPEDHHGPGLIEIGNAEFL